MSEHEIPFERWRKLRRHPAMQAGAVYVGGSWALIQVADIFFPNLDIIRGLGVALAIGFVAVVGGAFWMAGRSRRQASEDEPAPSPGSKGRARRRIAYAAAGGLVVLGAVFWWIRPNILGAVAPDAQVIAVLPFSASGPGAEPLGDGMVALLSPNLDGVGGIRTIDSRTVQHRWKQRAVDGTLDLEGSLAVGQDVGAGAVLLGSVVSIGPQVRLTAQLYSVKGTELASASVEGPADDMLALVDTLGLRVLREIWLAREPIPNLRVSGITTGSMDAIRAYLEGERYYRNSEWDSAKAAFQRALDEDSTFALAQYRLALTYGWDGGYGQEETVRHARAALRHADHLPPRERSLVVAHLLFEEAKIAALDSMQSYVERYPDDPEGWYMLGDVRYHARPLLALEAEDYLTPFDRVLTLDPSLSPAYTHPLELSIVFDDSARFAEYFRGLERAGASEYVELFSAGRHAWSSGDSVNLFSIFSRASALEDEFILHLYSAPDRHPEEILEEMEPILSGSIPSNTRLGLTQVQGMILASLGRIEEARTAFDSLWAMAGPASNMAYTSLLPVFAGLADSSFAAPAFSALANPPNPAARQASLYALSLVELARGNEAKARLLLQRAAVVEGLPDENPTVDLIDAALGWADVLAGDTLAGSARMRAGLEEAGYGIDQAIFMGQPVRFALAATQVAHPQTRREGIRRLRYSLNFTDVVQIPLAYLLLGQALEAEGEPAEAARSYERFIELWKDADPQLQPRVETARRALERLAAETTN